MSNPHALIVDDYQPNIDVLVMLLSREGLTYSTATSPRSLPQVIEQSNRIDIVFLDLEFPTSDGFSLLENLRADVRLAGVPIVAYTVHANKIDEARRAGFHSFLAKPLSVQLFPGQLKRILSNQPVWEI